MQVSVGTIQITNGSNRVISTENSFSSDWSQVAVGAWLVVSAPAAPVSYQVSLVVDPSSSSSGKWEVFLSVNYAGTTNLLANYAISSDFTSFGSIPLLNRGDAESASIFSRAMNVISALIQSLTTRVTTLEGYIAPAAAATINTVTLPNSTSANLLPGKHYRLTCTFTTGGTFSNTDYISHAAANNANAQIYRNENGVTTGACYWTVYAPVAITGAVFSGTLRGVFSGGTVTLNTSQALWALTQLD